MHQEKIIQEIKSTEETYIKHLSLLQQYFSTPILEQGLLPTHIHSSIFGQLPAIRRMNDELLEELMKAGQNIGLPFLKLGPFLKVYSSYANNFQQALGVIQQWDTENEEMKNFISGAESRPEVQMKFMALLITPIQRVPRYRMLLEELLKHTEPTEASYPDLKDALAQIRSVAEHINRSVDDAQMVQRLLCIQKAIYNQTPNIIVPGRKIIKEGLLNKVSRNGNGAQKRAFFLFNDVLMYAKTRQQHQLPSRIGLMGNVEFELKPNSLESCCILPLRHCRLKTLFGSGNQGITFRLQCSDEDILLYSDTSADGEEWINTIQQTAEIAARKRQTLRKESSCKTPRQKKLFKQNTSKVSTPRLKSPRPDSAIMTHLRSAKECLTSPRFWASKKHKRNLSPSLDDQTPDKKKTPTYTHTSKCSPTIASPLTLPHSPASKSQSVRSTPTSHTLDSTPYRNPHAGTPHSFRDTRSPKRRRPFSCQDILRKNLEKSLLTRKLQSEQEESATESSS